MRKRLFDCIDDFDHRIYAISCKSNPPILMYLSNLVDLKFGLNFPNADHPVSKK